MSDTPSVDTLLTRVRKSGFRLNNLFSRMDGQFQANLRKADNSLFFAWAFGVDAADALEKALEKAMGGMTAYRESFRDKDDDLDATLVGTTKGDQCNAGPAPAVATTDDEDLLGDVALPEDLDDLLGDVALPEDLDDLLG